MDESVTPSPVERELMYDLRTPLTVLIGHVQQPRRRHAAGRSPETLDGDLAAIEAALWRLATAINEAEAYQSREAKANE